MEAYTVLTNETVDEDQPQKHAKSSRDISERNFIVIQTRKIEGKLQQAELKRTSRAARDSSLQPMTSIHMLGISLLFVCSETPASSC